MSESHPAIRSTWRRRLRSWAGKVGLLAFSTLVALLLAEILVRLFFPQQLILLRSDIWVPDDTGLGWRMAPHVDTRVNTGEREIRLQTDAEGFRIGAPEVTGAAESDSRGPELPAEGLQVLALGDSFLAAIQVEYPDTVSARLERALSQEFGTPVRVANGGVGGWNPNQYLLRARSFLARHPTDLVLVLLFRGSDAVTQRQEYSARTSEVVHSFRLPRSLSRSEVIKSTFYPLNDLLERRSHLFILARKAGWQVLMRMGLSARRFPQAELRSEADSVRWQVTGEICQDIAEVAASQGAAALFVLVPGIYHVDPEIGRVYSEAIGLAWDDIDLDQTSKKLSRELEQRGLDYVDATPAVAAALSRGVQTHGSVDTHLSPAGHEVLAELLLPKLVEGLRTRSAAPASEPAAD